MLNVGLSQYDRRVSAKVLLFLCVRLSGYNVSMSEGDHLAAMKVLFFGLPAGISAAVLAELTSWGAVTGVVVPAAAVPHLLTDVASPVITLEPGRFDSLTIMGGQSRADTLGVAWEAGLPVLAVRDFAHPHAVSALRALAADVAVVACFTRRIPAALLAIPRHGFLNLHPSLLPDYRGPVPLFWQLRDGAPTGVTVHYMDDGFDTGDIVAQKALPLPDGSAGAESESTLMLAGVDLLRDILAELSRGVINRRPQPSGGSAQSFPQPGDFVLSTTWPARRAFNFMRGTAHFGVPYPVALAGDTVRLAVADHFEPAAELDRPSVRHGRSILIRFNPGILYARMAD